MNQAPTPGAGGVSESLFAMLLDLHPDHFYILDSNVKIVYVNKSTGAHFRLPKDQFVGKSFLDIEPDTEYARQASNVSRQIMAADKPHVADLPPYNEPGGTQRFLRRYDIPFRHPQTGDRLGRASVDTLGWADRARARAIRRSIGG